MVVSTAGWAEPPSLTGLLLVSWGDPDPDLGGPAQIDYHLVLDDGGGVTLEIGPATVAAAGGPVELNGKRVEVIPGPGVGAPGEASGPIEVADLRVLGSAGPGPAGPGLAAVIGSKPWVSILCKFADEADEPQTLAFFQGMYGGSPGGLDHYWRELSYDAVNVVGSTAVDWVTLPSPRSAYVPPPGPGSQPDLTKLFNDCTAAANPVVDFSNGGGGFEGINMMFNADLGCCAWGGTRWATLDGVNKSWRTTWEPPWGWGSAGVIGHEMGHGFGLPHSNNSDGDGSPYDSPWDVMSAATSFSVTDPTYGPLGKHTIAYHKELLGWIAAPERFVPPGPGVYPLTLDHLALAATTNLRMLRVPIGATPRSYLVEVREQQGNYDGMLPGNAVLIFEVDPSRDEPAWLVDADQPPADFSSNEGSMWKTGEIFEDLANEIRISVDGPSPGGFDVTLYYGTAPTLQANPVGIDFGNVSIGTASAVVLTLQNNSAGPETAIVFGMTLSDPSSFSLDPAAASTPCGSTTPTLPAGGSCTLEVGFAPQSESAYSEQLTIQSNAATPSLVLPLSGTGTACAFPQNVALSGTESGTLTVSACDTLTAGSYRVASPGQVRLRAATVELGEGLAVDAGAELAVENLP